ncbi:fibronectin type III domain-containing protein, partial [Microbacterium enclense]|uniref:fibronectin type III domain-containing protein n=3 Tax=Bacillati TaxID=1783272 RepID=UPI0036D9F2F2
MPDLISVYKTGPATTFVLGADLLRVDEDRNVSVLRCYLKATNGPGGSTGSYFNDAGEQQGHIENLIHWGTHSGRPFMPSGVANGSVRWLDVWDVEVGHGADGRRGSVTFRQYLGYGGVNESAYAEFGGFPRIAKPPATPPAPTLSHVTTTSVRVNGSREFDDGGAGIEGWQFQAATNTSFTSGVVTRDHDGEILDVDGLVPGRRYYFRYRARNRRGWSPWAGSPDVFVGLPAPDFQSWTQNTSGALVAVWGPPDPATSLSGYRVQIARNEGFTEGVQTFDVGNVNVLTIPGLAGGRYWWARVAARTAGGVNEYSDPLRRMLILSSGNLDSWTRLGTIPSSMAAFTAEGLRRGTDDGRQAIWVENLANSASSLPAGVGLQRRVSGLTIGNAYRFTAYGETADADVPAKVYKLRVVGEGDGPATTLSATGRRSLGTVEFVADATSAVLQIMLASTVTTAGAAESVERVAFTGMRLVELVTDYPVRLRETVYESSLANHFDLVCNSVGGSWYVGQDGVTRFRLPGAALPTSFVFTDTDDDNALHYIDVSASYDTRGMVNRLDVTNYGVDEDRKNEQNDELVRVDQASINSYGVRSARLETNLYGVAPYDESLNARLAALLADSGTPRLFISSVTWNAQENIAAANALDVGQRVTVRFNGEEQDSQIVSLQHDITPKRWIVTVA